jgi:hypothetical protein
MISLPSQLEEAFRRPRSIDRPRWKFPAIGEVRAS